MALCRPLQKGFAPSPSPECVSLPASRCRFMNHRVPSNCRYQPTEYEHAANCATHAVSPCPWVREGGAHLSGDPLRNLKGHLKMSVFSPGAATETLRAVMRQMCPVSSWGLGCSPSSCPGKLMHPPCSHPPWPHVLGESGCSLVRQEHFQSSLKMDCLTAGSVTGAHGAACAAVGGTSPPIRVSFGS